MNSKIFLYASSWKEHGGEPGLGLYEMDTETGDLSFIKMIDEKDSVNCSHISAPNGCMYICNEDVHVWGEAAMSGQIIGYKLNKENGDAQRIFSQITYCPNPAFVSVDSTGTYMVVAHHSAPVAVAKLKEDENGNYNPVYTHVDAAVQLYRLDEKGVPCKLLDHVCHVDENGNATHPHCCVFSPSENLIAVCDKGDGHLYLYSINKKKNKLILKNKVLTDVPGASPRYCVFHPTKPYLYVNHEKQKNHKLIVVGYEYKEDGSLIQICSTNAVPEDYVIPENIHHEQQGFVIHPSGNYLYTLLNGPNAVGVFKIEEDGTLTLIQNAKIKGIRPRGLAISPDGKFIVTSCLVSGDIAVYRVTEKGLLEKTENHVVQKGTSYFSFYENNIK